MEGTEPMTTNVGLDRDALDMMLDSLDEFVAEALPDERRLEFDHEDICPEETIRAMCGEDLGVHLVFIPEEYGGLGGGAFDSYRVCERLARIDIGIATSVFATFLGTDPILVGATPEQRKEWLGRIAEQGILFAYGATEPEAGSDLGAMRTTATPVETDGQVSAYRLNGRKQWISNGSIADVYSVLALAPGGPSWFIVEKGTAGFSSAPPEDKHGIRLSNTAALFLDDVVVPAENLIGREEGRGLVQAQQVFGYTRVMVAAFGLGGGWEALDRAIAYSQTRVQGGAPLSAKQGFTHKLIVPHAVRLEAARAFLEETATRIDAGEGAGGALNTEGAIAKYMATEAGNAAAEAAIQAHGGYGYTRPYMVEKIKRDVRITTIYEGTSEILEMTIARDRWQQHLKSSGAYYRDAARTLDGVPEECGGPTAALALECLAGGAGGMPGRPADPQPARSAAARRAGGLRRVCRRAGAPCGSGGRRRTAGQGRPTLRAGRARGGQPGLRAGGGAQGRRGGPAVGGRGGHGYRPGRRPAAGAGTGRADRSARRHEPGRRRTLRTGGRIVMTTTIGADRGGRRQRDHARGARRRRPSGTTSSPAATASATCRPSAGTRSLYYDPDPHAPDKTYSRIGGWVRDFPWEPLAWKLPIPPAVSAQMDDGQKWAVACTRAALLDAGWPDWTVDPERVAVIIGNAIGGDKQHRSNLRIQFPEFARDLCAAPSFAALPEQVRDAVLAETRASFLDRFEEITEDTMPGELANVIAGRVAEPVQLPRPQLHHRRGVRLRRWPPCRPRCAACRPATSTPWSPAAIDRNMDAPGFVKFCKIGALSATGTRPFDAGADGFVMGEGAALFVLKRLSDAERDGDRIYAVLLGVAGSSDGRGKGITAPNPVGQRLAVERAWHVAGVDPASATCIEAHGTSTRVGDATELASLTDVFRKAGAANGSIALGSVKSNIGHLKGAAGAAGLFKAVLSLHDKVLAPSLHFEHPNESVDWDDIPFRVNTELREWPAPESGVRCAGVSAFGFGGTNFHAVLEEYVPGRHRAPDASRSFAGATIEHQSTPTRASTPAGRKAPLRGAAVVGGADDAEVAAQLERLGAEASAGRVPAPAAPDPALAGAAVRVAIDYADAGDLAAKAGKAVQALRGGNPAMWKILRAQGVFVGRGAPGKVAFLYTGQGSQYVNMLRDLRQREPLVAATFDEADRVMAPLLGKPLTEYIFADNADEATAQRLEQQLMQTEITQPAVLTTDLALTRMLDAYGVRPDMVMGHSLGEYGALVAAGALSFDAALEAVSARGREMANLAVGDNGAMAAVLAPLAEIERIVAETDGYVVVANINSTGQAVIGGATDAVERAVAAFQAAGMNASRIPVSHAFHTEIVAPVSEPLRAVLRRLNVRPSSLPIVSNVTGDFYPENADADTMLDLLGRQVASPVRFIDGLHTLHAAGARVFVEVGPKKALHGFVEDVLGDDVLALFTNHPKIGDVASFNQALCGLYAAGLGYAEQTPVAAAPAPTASTETAMTDAQYTELGRHLVDVVQHGLHAETGPAVTARPPTPAAAEPVVVTGAALGLPGVERVFDDENIARILDGQQFIDTIPHRLRREMLDRHITRLVKRASGDPSFEAIDNEAEVIKLAGRSAPLDVVSEFGVDTARDAALDSTTRLAIGAGFDALRDAGIPLVMHYKTTTLGTKLPDRWGLPESMRDDTGVIFASAFPGLDNFAHDLERYYIDRSQPRTAERTGGGARADERRRAGRGGAGPAHPRAAPHPRDRSVRVRPALLVPVPVDGALAVRRDHRRARTEHAGQRGVREHHAGGGGGRGLDPHRPLPAGGGGVRRRREFRRASAVARVGILGIWRGCHRRPRRRGGHTVRPAPARDDPGHGGGGPGGGICRGRFRTRAATDLRGPRHGDREQRIPRHPARRRAHRRRDGETARGGRGTWGEPARHFGQHSLRLTRDLHAGPWRQRVRRDTRAAPGVRSRRRRGRHHQHQGLHRARDGRRRGGRRRDQVAGNRHRAAGAQLQGAGSRAGTPQPVDRRQLSGRVRAAAGRRIRFADRDDADALDAGARRSPPPAGRTRV